MSVDRLSVFFSLTFIRLKVAVSDFYLLMPLTVKHTPVVKMSIRNKHCDKMKGVGCSDEPTQNDSLTVGYSFKICWSVIDDGNWFHAGRPSHGGGVPERAVLHQLGVWLWPGGQHGAGGGGVPADPRPAGGCSTMRRDTTVVSLVQTCNVQ